MHTQPLEFYETTYPQFVLVLEKAWPCMSEK